MGWGMWPRTALSVVNVGAACSWGTLPGTVTIPPRAWGDVESSVGDIINDNPDPIPAEAAAQAATTDAAEVMEVDVSGSPPPPRLLRASRASVAF